MTESQYAAIELRVKRILGRIGTRFRNLGLGYFSDKLTISSTSKGNFSDEITPMDAQWAVDNWDALVAERRVVIDEY